MNYSQYLFQSPLYENTYNNETVTVNLWGKKLTLDIDYNVDDKSEITSEQRQELKKFIKNFNIVNNSLSKVKQYCLERDGVNIPNKKIYNIFKYIQPKSIFIKTIHNKVLAIALMCEYIFNPEHGIAIVFKDGNLIDIGEQNIIL